MIAKNQVFSTNFFEPTLKSSLFSGSNFSTFFSSICPKSAKVKNRPYLTVIRAQKHKELHIMSQLYASEVYQMFCNTRYF